MLIAKTTNIDHMKKIKTTIITELAAVETELKAIQSDIPILNEVSSQLLKSGGKRLRPVMAIASALSCGYKGSSHIALASIIELIHAATLLHDDVIDNSIKRRYQDTANKVWGNKNSILAGDYIYSIAFQKMVAIPDPKVLKVLSEATSYIVEGEIIQLTQAHNPNTSIASYLEVITRKTARLFKVAAELGAVISNAETKQINSLSNIGNSFGMAYQIINDLDDYDIDHGTGKNICDDLLEGKPTLPYILAYNNGSKTQKELLAKCLTKSENKIDIDSVITILTETNAFTQTKEYANNYLKSALDELALFDQSISCTAPHGSKQEDGNKYTACIRELIYYLQSKVTLQT